MSQVSTVPVTISDEAAAHIAQLGMQAEFEQGRARSLHRGAQGGLDPVDIVEPVAAEQISEEMGAAIVHTRS